MGEEAQPAAQRDELSTDLADLNPRCLRIDTAELQFPEVKRFDKASTTRTALSCATKSSSVSGNSVH
ncbi:MAG: hypothetical protein ACR2PF_18320 [Rhizobiaceae bacterium]